MTQPADTESFGGEDPPPSPCVKRPSTRVKQQATFNEQVIALALARGGTLDTSAWRPSVVFAAPCGPLHVMPVDTFIACRFDDVEWARALLPHEPRLSRSGKWNFDGGLKSLPWFDAALGRLLALPAVERPLPLSQLPKPPPKHTRVRLTQEGTSLVVKVLRKFGDVWVMHYGVGRGEDGEFAACPGARGRTITHAPTGILIKHTKSVKEAVALGQVLGQRFPVMGADLNLDRMLGYEDVLKLQEVCA